MLTHGTCSSLCLIYNERMKKLFTKGTIALIVIFSVLIIDQIIKIWIKTHMYWHESIRVTDWFYIYFTENNGMAFGMEIFGKLFLTTFRIVAVALIGWYLYKIIKKGFKTNEEINIRKTLVPAYLALVLTLGITIWQNFSADNSDIITIQNQLTEILQTLNDNPSPDLTEIENKIQEIIDTSDISISK